jgi:hypothetical protein
MASAVCGVCGAVQNIRHDKLKYLHRSFSHLCSARCLLNRIWSYPTLSSEGKERRFKHYEWFVDLPDDSPIPQREQGPVWSRALGKAFHSRYEIELAKWFNAYAIAWLYEEIFVRVNGTTIYIPDFYLPSRDVVIEVKGFWGQGQKQKMTDVQEQHPSMRLILVPWTLERSIKKDRKNAGILA